MRSAQRLAQLSALAIAACLTAACGDDDAVKPTTPVTIKFTTPIYSISQQATDTARGWVIMDGTDSVRVPEDSFVNVPRGQHRFDYRLDKEYLTDFLEGNLDPTSSRVVLEIPLARNCRDIAVDGLLCVPNGVPKNVVVWSKHTRPFCNANDFGEFCTAFSDVTRSGGTWPDSGNPGNPYITHAKLLVAATMGPELGSDGAVMAMALFNPGDYAPRSRLRAIGAPDTLAFQNEVWTDARSLPLFLRPNAGPSVVLSPDDRADHRFGLSVKATYFVPNGVTNPAVRDVIFARYDVQNISNEPDYRFVHETEPATGHTLRDVYLVPTVDPNIGGTNLGTEEDDDNATAFASESLLVAYDQSFNVPGFGLLQTNGTTNTFHIENPGLVGLRLLDGPAGTTARPMFLDYAGDSLSFYSAVVETKTHATLSGGRASVPAGCVLRGEALVCTAEAPSDVIMGWSVGPIASLAPGQSTSITVALFVAPPKAGTFTTGTAVAPRNDALGTVESPLFPIAENLRALSAAARAYPLPATP